ncbi:hypothetical protein PtB15_6B693 [Puccinia triticina]|nr:hypothetical protein PtB15_6B693 [Puccinia triticina]
MYYVSRAENHGASSGRPALLDRFVDWKIPRMLLRNKLNQILAENLLATRRCWAPPSYTISRASSTDTHSDPSSSSPAASSSSSSSSSLSDLPPHTHPASTRLLPVRPSTSKHPRPSPKENTTLAAAALLSRSPLLLRPLTEFEDAYYQYQRELNLALAKPVRPSFFFRPGSHAAKAFDLSLKSSQAIHLPSAPDLDSSASQPTQQKLSLQNLEREPHRSIYLFVKLLDPQSQKSQWQLPTSQILPTDNLTQASLRAVHSGLGPNMDIWSIGKVPATVYTPSPGSSFDKTNRRFRYRTSPGSLRTKFVRRSIRAFGTLWNRSSDPKP